MTQPSAQLPGGAGHVDELDPANQSLADALRKSFRVLKLIMLVLVVLYFLSGWFSVKPNEAGVILRYGRIVGTGTDLSSAVLGPGWHLSWPYPIEQWMTVSKSEREVPVQFMFQLSDEEQTRGIQGYKYNLLSPLRDDYLITGNVNILHAALTVKYRITDPVAYLTNVSPMPSEAATVRGKPYLQYPEYTILTSIVRDAVIETASRRNDLDIRGSQQNEFLQAVASVAMAKLKHLDQMGTPLGISIDPANGILAPKTSGVEGIMPPRQTQQAFDDVDKANSTKVTAITRASADAKNLLVNTAGMEYEPIAQGVDVEFDLMQKLSAEKKDSPTAEKLRSELAAQRAAVDKLIVAASGDVRNIIQRAEIRRDHIIKEAAGDYQQFKSVLPVYEQNPAIFMSQILAETFTAALSNDLVSKYYVPDTPRPVWLVIPRTGVSPQDSNKPKESKPGVIEIAPAGMRATVQ